MKICSTCKELKPFESYNKKSSNKDGLERYCKPCHKKRNKKHYVADSVPYKERAKHRRKKVSEWWSEYKSNLKCEVCEESRPWCLDFHHLDPSAKEGTLSQIVNSKSKASLELELAKCIVVCRNCHADIHHKERQKQG